MESQSAQYDAIKRLFFLKTKTKSQTILNRVFFKESPLEHISFQQKTSLDFVFQNGKVILKSSVPPDSVVFGNQFLC